MKSICDRKAGIILRYDREKDSVTILGEPGDQEFIFDILGRLGIEPDLLLGYCVENRAIMQRMLSTYGCHVKPVLNSRQKRERSLGNGLYIRPDIDLGLLPPFLFAYFKRSKRPLLRKSFDI